MAKRKTDPEAPADEQEAPADEGDAREPEPDPEPTGPLVVTRTFNTPQGRPAIVTDPLPEIGVEVEYESSGVIYRGTPIVYEWWKNAEMAVFDHVTPVRILEED